MKRALLCTQRWLCGALEVDASHFKKMVGLSVGFSFDAVGYSSDNSVVCNSSSVVQVEMLRIVEMSWV